MDCQQRQDLIPLYAAGELSDAQRQEVEVHLSTGCPECAGRVAEARAMLAQLALTLPAQSPPSQTRQRVLANLSPRSASDSAGGAAAGGVFAGGGFGSDLPKKGNSPRSMDRVIIPSALAALLAVALTLGTVHLAKKTAANPMIFRSKA